MEKILQLEARRRVFEAVRDNPGIHMRGLERETGMAMGTLRYQLRYLEKHGLIVERKEGRMVTYYLSEGKNIVDAQDKGYLAILRQEIPRLIVLHLMMNPNSTHGDLKPHFKISPSTLSYHLKKLTESEIIVKEDGKYRVRDEDRVAKVLITYRQTFVDAMVDAFVRFWEGRK